MTTRTLRGVAVLAALVGAAACADKAFRPLATAVNPKFQLVVTAMPGQAASTPSPKILWIGAAGIIPSGDTNIIAMKNVPVSGATSQSVTLDVDISKCVAATAAAGGTGCKMLVGAALRADSIAENGDHDPFHAAYDYTVVGPFEVGNGKVPTIPTIDLSRSRFTVLDWIDDDALRLGSAQHALNFNGAYGAVLAGTLNASNQPVLYSVGQTVQIPTTSSNGPQQFPIYPSLSIFENGNWRRLLATSAPTIQPGAGGGFFDVAAVAPNEVYIAGTGGLYKYDGVAISKVAGIAESMFAVAQVAGGASRLFIASGTAGTVYIGDGTTWTKSTVPLSIRLDNACINSTSEAYVASYATGDIFRWNGTSWSAVTVVPTVAKMDLQCAGPNKAFVTALNQNIFQWTGTGWSPIPFNGIGNGRLIRIGVNTAGDMYAAGDSAATNRAFYRWNGSSWVEVARSRFTQSIGRPWIDSKNGAAYMLSSFGRLERFSSSGMTVLSYQPALKDISVTSGTSAFAVGWNLFLARWDGAKWTIDQPPAGTPTVRLLQGVWSDGSKNAWTVASSSTILHWDGASWGVVSDQNRPVTTRDNYNAVWGIGSDVWIAGDAFITRCKSVTACATETSSGGAQLASVWGTSATDVYAAGTGGKILHYDGTTWSPFPSPTSRNIGRITGSSKSDLWIVGDSVIAHYNGTQWNTVPLVGNFQYAFTRVPGTLQGMFQVGVWVKGTREAYLGTDNGTIFRYDGADLNESYIPGFFGRRIISISGGSDGCVLALAEAQTEFPYPSIKRGRGTNGCFAAPMQPPSTWY